ncbi:DNA repair protein REV1-like isoform X2 [Zophobas morio]|uniref:DNA repair protein REV1-like isoform X2 n=1 Tax=Zophobas morio TaxID=2755281 RepID=UPI003082C4D2
MWHDHGSYIKVKKAKLEKQQQDIQDLGASLFKGMSFYVDGYTSPSAMELKHLIVKHGGIYHHFFSSSKTTHVIATSVPPRKHNHFRKQKVVRPKWITSCIAEHKLLDPYDYLIIPEHQKTIFFPADNRDINVVDERINHSEVTTSSVTSNLTTNNIHENDNNNIKSSNSNKLQNESLRTLLEEHYTTDTSFIKAYYRSSRLSHLSKWRAEVKELTSSLQKNTAKKSSQLNFITNKRLRYIFHVDIDAFFVSASLLQFPQFRELPVVICHSQADSSSFASTSEISSCNYVARQKGIKSGMMLCRAKSLCQNLITLPYDFALYKKVMGKFYEVVMSYSVDVQGVSCDEVFMDVSAVVSDITEAKNLAENIKQKILCETGCTASIGVGSNMFLARCATKFAKPSNIYHLALENFEAISSGLPVRELPGIGHSLSKQLWDKNVRTCAELRRLDIAFLRSTFGKGTGELLYRLSRGIDRSPLKTVQPRKSVSVEISWGVRFRVVEEVHNFIKELSCELHERLERLSSTGKSLTLKVKAAKEGHERPAKFLGHGVCVEFSKTSKVPAIHNSSVISNCSIGLFDKLCIHPTKIRGIGIHISKLFPKGGLATRYLKKVETSENSAAATSNEASGVSANHSGENEKIFYSSLPSQSKVDPHVFASLPSSVQKELLSAFEKKKLYLASRHNDGRLKQSLVSFTTFPLIEVTAMLREWIPAHEPDFREVDLFIVYLLQLLENRHMTSLASISPAWTNEARKVSEAVQQWMIHNWGARLKLARP